jgi:hypothetical protein
MSLTVTLRYARETMANRHGGLSESHGKAVYRHLLYSCPVIASGRELLRPLSETISYSKDESLGDSASKPLAWSKTATNY